MINLKKIPDVKNLIMEYENTREELKRIQSSKIVENQIVTNKKS